MLVIWPFVIVTPVFTVVKDVGVAGMTTPFCMRAGLYVVGTGISRPTVIENERTTGAGPPISITFLRAATGRRAVSGVDTGGVEGVADGSEPGSESAKPLEFPAAFRLGLTSILCRNPLCFRPLPKALLGAPR